MFLFKGLTPLIFAVRGRNRAIVKLLIENGANVNDKSKQGKLITLFWGGLRQNLLSLCLRIKNNDTS